MAEREWHQLYFDKWVEREGLDLIRGYKVDNVYTLPLKDWQRTGGKAVQIQLEGTGELNAACVSEIPPGGQLQAAEASVRGDHLRPARPWRHVGVAGPA